MPRFRFDGFISPGETLKQGLDRICIQTCSAYQWRSGKIRMIPANAANHVPVFDVDLYNIASDFNFSTLSNAERPNTIEVFYRDLNTELLEEIEKPLTVKRQSLIDANNGRENVPQSVKFTC